MLNIFEVLDIKEQEIFTKIPCVISINKSEYKDVMVEYEDRYRIPGVIDIYFPDLDDYTQLITSYDGIGVLKTSTYEETKQDINIKYESGDRIIQQDYVDSNINLPLIRRMLNGKLEYIKNPEALVVLLHTALPKSDIVHLEVILSNIFRDNSSGEPARFTGSYSNSTQVGVLQLGKTDSWLSSIAFQNIDQGINRALVSNKPAKMNPIELVLNEQFQSL
jgi:hypothetical protein